MIEAFSETQSTTNVSKLELFKQALIVHRVQGSLVKKRSKSINSMRKGDGSIGNNNFKIIIPDDPDDQALQTAYIPIHLQQMMPSPIISPNKKLQDRSSMIMEDLMSDVMDLQTATVEKGPLDYATVFENVKNMPVALKARPDRIEGATQLNLLFDNFEKLICEWQSVAGKALKARAKVMDACGITPEMVANPKHIVIGALLLVLAENGSTFEELKQIFFEGSPHIKVEEGKFNTKHEDLLLMIQDWSTACCESIDNFSTLNQRLKDIPRQVNL